VDDAAGLDRPRVGVPERVDHVAVERRPAARDADPARHDDHLLVGEQLEVHPRALLDVPAQATERGRAGQRPARRRVVLGRAADRRRLKGGESQYGRDRLHFGL
jgi:hypothetical protein